MREKQGSRGAEGQGSGGVGEQEGKGARESKTNLPISQSPNLLLWLLILSFAIFFSALALRQHAAFQTNGLDLGNVDQALWNTAHRRFLYFTLMTPVESRLALHVEPILLAFVPFYWLGLGGPALLLISQAGIVALGAWPLYQLASGKWASGQVGKSASEQVASGQVGKWQVARGQVSKSASGQVLPDPELANLQTRLLANSLTRKLAYSQTCLLAFPLAYLLLPTLQAAVLFDFHAVTLAPTFFLFAFLALEQRRDRAFVLFLLLAMACKEDMPLVAAMVGLYAGLARRRWRLAGLTIGLSALWFGLAFFVIQPNFAAGGNIQLDRYGWLGDSPPAMVATLLTQPGLVFDHLWRQADLPGYLLWLFFPTAFLALLSPLTLLPLLPPLAVNLLSDNPFTWRLEDFHYGAPLAPFLFISAVYGTAWLVGRVSQSGGAGERGSRGNKFSPPTPAPLLPRPSASLPVLSRVEGLLCLILLAFSLIYHTQRGYTPLAHPFEWPVVITHERELAAYLNTLPSQAPLFTQSNLAPHLSQRSTLYTDFAYFTDPDFPAPAPVEAVVLDVTTFENFGGLHQFLRQTLLEGGGYELIAAQDGLLHFKTTSAGNLPPSALPVSFYTFAHPTRPAQYPLTVDFAGEVRLHGYSLHFNRQEEIQVSLDLAALQPLTDVQPVLYLLDEWGNPQGATTDLQPGLVWYPVEQWPVGETVRLRFNTLPWHTRQTERYRLALGFIRGSDPWAVDQRLTPRPTETGPYALRLPAAGSLIELARLEQRWGMPAGGPPQRQFTAPTPSHPLNVTFANQIQLLGYEPPIIDNHPAPQLSITLAWQALTDLPLLVRFVQLIGPDGQVYGQQDSAPDNGHYPTPLWQPGEVVVETVTFPLPPERPAGRYTLHLGFYAPDSGQRLPLPSGGDHVEIELP